MSNSSRGFFTIAQNSASGDYLQMARTQAQSLKLVSRYNQYAVAVDSKTAEDLTEDDRSLFDKIVYIEHDFAEDSNWKLANCWQAFALTPWKETIHVESDVIFTTSTDPWWALLQKRDVVLSTEAYNVRGHRVTTRQYREFNDRNLLPDVYSGLTYFRRSDTAFAFFETARQLFSDWEKVITFSNLVHAKLEPTTDQVYALASEIVGRENTTLPNNEVFGFVHMKPACNGWPHEEHWSRGVFTEVAPPNVRIAMLEQTRPVHYHDKEWLTKYIIKQFKDAYANRI